MESEQYVAAGFIGYWLNRWPISVTHQGKDSSKEFTFATFANKSAFGDISKWFIGRQSVHGDWKLTTYCSFEAVLWLHFKSCHFYIYVMLFSLEWTLVKTYLTFVFSLSCIFSHRRRVTCLHFYRQSFQVTQHRICNFTAKMVEQLERYIDLNRTKVRLPDSCWSWACSSRHRRRSGVDVQIKTRQEGSSFQVRVMFRCKPRFRNFLTAVEENRDVTASPEIHNHLPGLLNFEWLIIF